MQKKKVMFIVFPAAAVVVLIVLLLANRDKGPGGAYYYIDLQTGIMNTNRGLLFQNGEIRKTGTNELISNYSYENGVITTVGNDGLYTSTYDRSMDRVYINVDHEWYAKPDDPAVKQNSDDYSLTGGIDDPASSEEEPDDPKEDKPEVETEFVTEISMEEEETSLGTEYADNEDVVLDDIRITCNKFIDMGMETAKIYAFQSGVQGAIWSVLTDYYEIKAVPQISDIGVFDGRYYYVEAGTVKALDAATGELVWENHDFCGASPVSCFDSNGTLYLSGFNRPDLFAVNKDGVTIYREECIEESLRWPIDMHFHNNALVITMGGSPIDCCGEYWFDPYNGFELESGDTSFSPIQDEAMALTEQRLIRQTRKYCKSLNEPEEVYEIVSCDRREDGKYELMTYSSSPEAKSITDDLLVDENGIGTDELRGEVEINLNEF